jgi:pimeloyl-ACP methyl ester carboxylesterase
LRFDVEGVGDSGARAPDDQSRILYSDGAIEDVADAAQWLAARGYAQIVAFGICSGGYTALHAAARSPAVSGVISINLQRFVWPEGLTIQEAIKRQANSTRAYAASMLEWRKWRQVLRGDKSFVAIAGTLLSHGVARLRRPLARALEQLGAPTQSPERALAATLERCGTRTLLVYGSYDPGVDELVRHFGQGGRMLSASKHTRIVFDDALDHALFGQDAGDNVIQLCKTFFSDGLHRAHDDAKRISIAASWKTS